MAFWDAALTRWQRWTRAADSNRVPTEREQEVRPWARWAPIFVAAYAVAVLVLGLADAAVLVARVGDEHRLTLVELLLLPFISMPLTPLLHLALLAAGLAYVAILSRLPGRLARHRVALLCLPIGVVASVTARAAKHLPLIKRTPLLETGTWVATIAAPIAFIGLGLLLATVGRSRPWLRRACLAGLLLALAMFVFVVGLTEEVLARIPGTIFALVALTYMVGYLLRDVERPLRAAVALALSVALASAYVAFLPSARSARALAIVAHKTQLLQALMFTELALFTRSPGFPECSAPPAPPEPLRETRSHNILLITLDAMRADHMSAYGYDRVTMPNAEALLREAVVFDTAYSAAPATSGSLTAMWTASSAYTMRALGHWPKTLHERLRELGYRILGTDLSRVADNSAPGRSKTPLWDASIGQAVKAAELADTLIDQIRATKGPFFATAHFHETHDEGARRYVPKVFPEGPLSRYDDSIFEIDRHIGRILAELRTSGRYDDTVIAFGSDHGEFFGEHARFHHGSLLYEPVVRVPFALKLPGTAARREATFASGFDLAPTLLKAATGRPWPVVALGHDVIGEIAAGRRDRAVFMENVSTGGIRRVVAVRKGRFKYTLLRGTRVEELFDLERDPGELDNLAGEDPVTLKAMRAELDAALHSQACELKALKAGAR